MINNLDSFESESSYESDDNCSLSDDDIQENSDNLELEGKILGKYNILNKIGSGSYSIVWLGYNITNNIFYAIKVQNPSDYKCGVGENSFMRKLPEKSYYFNNLIEDFTEIYDDKKYLCSVYELHYGNLDVLLRKTEYDNGLPFNSVIKIMKQCLLSLHYLHTKLRVYHGDLKTDNILLKGISEMNKNLLDLYREENFGLKYNDSKKNYCAKKNIDIKNIKSKIKKKMREELHSEIYNNINNKLKTVDINKYDINSDYINNCIISLADFGSFVEEGEHYDESFGTRYYRSPENILVGKSSYPSDIWAMGCTFYELLTGEILFDPSKDKEYDRDFHHLKLINEISNNFPLDFLKKTKLWKQYFDKEGNLKFYKTINIESFEDKLKSKIPENYYSTIINLIRKMLEIVPTNRIDAKESFSILEKIN